MLPEPRVRIWADRGFVPPGIPHTPILWPFWGPAVEPEEWQNAGRFDRWAEVGAGWFELVESPSDADFVVFPLSWNVCSANGLAKKARAVGDVARAAGKTLLVFADSDMYDEIPFLDALVFRSAINRSARGSREWALPGWVPDIARTLPERSLRPRPYEDIPVVGFCGCVELTPTLYGRLCERWVRMSGRAPANPPLDTVMRLRRNVLRSLEGSPRVKTNFITRRGYFGGSADHRAGGAFDSSNAAVVRRQYVQNMLDSDYIVCVRGGSNFSYRFYETLCCGRIPIFIDTDCVLPFEDRIDWKNCIVSCDERELADLPKKVEEFHRRHTPESFRALQLDCRRLWEEWLSPEGFFSQLHNQLTAAMVRMEMSVT